MEREQYELKKRDGEDQELRMSQAHRCGIDVGVLLFFLKAWSFSPLCMAVKNVPELFHILQ